MIVLPVGSVGSRPRLAIDSDACRSVSAVQVVPPSLVTKMPPLVEPAKIVFAPSAGSGKNGLDRAGLGPVGRGITALHRGERPKARRWPLRDKRLIDLKLREGGARPQQSDRADKPTHAFQHRHPPRTMATGRPRYIC